MIESVLFKMHSQNFKSEIKCIRKYLEASEKTPSEVTTGILSYTLKLDKKNFHVYLIDQIIFKWHS